MTESTPAEPSMTSGPDDTPPAELHGDKETEPTEATEPAGAAREGIAAESTAGDEAAAAGDDGQAVAGKRRWLILVGAAVVLVLLAFTAVALFVFDREEKGEVGECVRDTVVVACTEPHEARIVQVVEEVNGCAPPATHAMKDADRRYLCLVEEPS